MRITRRSILAAAGAGALVPPVEARNRFSRGGGGGNAINLQSYGLKSIHTTGNMPAASNQLTLPSSAGFSPGDYIIVAVGGEAGAGQRGTVGVGGTWPAKSYATVGAMNADTSQVVNLYAWVVATGDVYQWSGSAWVLNSSNPTPSYYTDKAVPMALVTQITAIGGGGTVLTLANPSVAATTGANVYFDNQYVFDTVLNFGSPLPNSNVTLLVPAGSYAIGDQIQWEPNGATPKDRWTLEGQGKDVTTLFSPDGAPSVMFLVEQLTNVTVRDLSILGNGHQQKYGLQWGPRNPLVTQTLVTQGRAFPSGFLFSSCVGVNVHDINVTDVFQNAVGGSFSDAMTVARVLCVMTEPLRQYIQWFFECADTTVGGTFTDCEVSGAYLIPGFEGFRSLNVQYIRPVGINATMSMNDVGNFLIQDANLQFTAGCQFDEDSFSGDNPIVNINVNIGSAYASMGGAINNIVMNQQGYINASDDTLIGININTPNTNVNTNGTSYTAPNYNALSTRNGAIGFNSVANNTHVSNFTVVGTVKSGQCNIAVLGTSGSTISSCTAGVICGP